MSNLTNNIPAYPIDDAAYCGGLNEAYAGMTLLDHFAGLAMQADIANCGGYSNGKEGGASPERRLAEQAYLQAAAMLEARKQYIP